MPLPWAQLLALHGPLDGTKCPVCSGPPRLCAPPRHPYAFAPQFQCRDAGLHAVAMLTPPQEACGKRGDTSPPILAALDEHWGHRIILPSPWPRVLLAPGEPGTASTPGGPGTDPGGVPQPTLRQQHTGHAAVTLQQQVRCGPGGAASVRPSPPRRRGSGRGRKPEPGVGRRGGRVSEPGPAPSLPGATATEAARRRGGRRGSAGHRGMRPPRGSAAAAPSAPGGGGARARGSAGSVPTGKHTGPRVCVVLPRPQPGEGGREGVAGRGGWGGGRGRREPSRPSSFWG